MMNNKVLNTIEEYNLIKQGDLVTVALSGGSDSVALLCVLHELSNILNFKINAHHINHCLRGKESDDDELFCRNLCSSLNIQLKVDRIDVNSYCNEHKISIEEGARILRYKALQTNSIVATAHHLDDNLETTLINLIRGTSIDGLCGIPIKRDNIIRPLIFCSKNEIEKYLKEKDLEYRTDSSNLKDDYVRNKIRHNIIPLFKEINSNVLNNVSNMNISLNQDRNYINNQVDSIYDNIILNNKICNRSYLLLDNSLKNRILKKYLSSFNLSFDFNLLNCLNDLIISKKGSWNLNKDYIFKVDNDFSYIDRINVVIKNDAFLKTKLKPGTIDFLDCIINFKKLSSDEINLFTIKTSKEYKYCIDCDKIKKDIFIRTRNEGDTLDIPRRNGKKTLKKLFIENKIPILERNKYIIFSTEDDVIFVEKFGVDKKYSISKDSKNVIQVFITRG